MTWWRTDAESWSSGGWSLEVRGDELAEIRRDGRMLLRSVRAVIRDDGWNTVPVEVRSLRTSPSGIELELRHEGLGARIASRLMVEVGAGAGADLRIAWDAVSEVEYDTCRTGLVVLHPASDAGAPVTVTHSDGSVEQTSLPVAISPHQPIEDIRELRIGSLVAQFEGEVFEMEDQRNWTDASFKTYSRPLALPYPYRLATGERVAQSITLRAEEVAPLGAPDVAPSRRAAANASPAHPADVPDTMIELSAAGPFPSIGVEASTAPDPVPVSGIGAFRVVELDLTTPNWRAALERAASDRRPLDVRLVSGGDAELLDAAALALRDHDVLRVAAFDAGSHVSGAAVIDAARASLAAHGIAAPILGGSRAHFTELNREQHRIPRDVDGIAVNATPLFHSLDTEQLVEAVAMQRLIAEQTVRIADDRAVHIGPISLRPRFNNVATRPGATPSRTDLSEGYGAGFTGTSDERQRAAELAAWAIASAAALAVPGVESLSWFETWGPRGLGDAGGPFPVASAIEALIALTGGTLLSGTSPDGLVWAIGSRLPDADAVLVANLDRVARRVSVRTPGQATQDVAVEPGGWTRVSAAR